MTNVLCIRHPRAEGKDKVCLECIRHRDRDEMTLLLPLIEMDHQNRDRLTQMCTPASKKPYLEESV